MRWGVIGPWVLALACTAKTDDGDPFGSGASSPGTFPPAADTGDGATGDASATSTTAATSGGSGASDDAMADDTAGIYSATTSECVGMVVGSAVLGETCMDGCECASGICYSLPVVGSACSQCLVDADCQVGGVGTCSFDPDIMAAGCTAGELGVMCQPSAAGCAAGLVCAQVVDTNGLLPDTFCSECATSADCRGTDVCIPMVVFDLTQPAGSLQCVAPGSGADGSLCPANGDASSCASGTCAVVDVGGLGIAEIGVCGPCATDADCGAGMTCQPPVVDENGAVPSACI